MSERETLSNGRPNAWHATVEEKSGHGRRPARTLVRYSRSSWPTAAGCPLTEKELVP